MKTSDITLTAVSMLLTVANSCSLLNPDRETATMETHFIEQQYHALTRSQGEIPDTNDFILKISSSSGETVYNGPFGASPEILEISPGSYLIEALSRDFSKPEFSAPQYGDSQFVIVQNGQNVNVSLNCSQINSGIRLDIPPEFLTAFPQGVLSIESDEGSLIYGYSEKRTAYFIPGRIDLILNEGSRRTPLFSRNLERREILSLNIKVASEKAEAGTSSSIDLQTDTSRIWTSEDVVLGGSGGKGQSQDEAYSVNEAKAHIGEKDVWIYGYIVGGDLSSSKISFTPPFVSTTNLAIASKSSVTVKSSCLSVQLKQGPVRDALNLVDNENLLGKKITLKGDIVESYFGIPGIQNIEEFVQ